MLFFSWLLCNGDPDKLALLTAANDTSAKLPLESR